MKKLSQRLAAVVALAGSGGSVVDVGTDHGAVPVWFVRHGLFDRVAASDIRRGPLERARAAARACGAEGEIAWFLSDGLRDVPGEFDTVIAAGMGGETIVDILSGCPWIYEANLVLQPQSKVEKVEAWLNGAGFTCERAALARDAGRFYAVFRAVRGEGGFDLLRALEAGRDPLLAACLARERERIERALAGMERGARRGSLAYWKLSGRRADIDNAIAEVRTWQR